MTIPEFIALRTASVASWHNEAAANVARVADKLRPLDKPSPATGYPFAVAICCRSCRSQDVRRDAYAAWNTESQDWELASVYDDGWCNECDGESRLVERMIDAEGNDLGPLTDFDRFEGE